MRERDTNELPWQIVGGYVISGVFETERENQLAEAVNRAQHEARVAESMESYRRGVEDGKALYEPRTWLGRLFG